MHIYIYIYAKIYTYVCVYIYIYIHIYIHKPAHWPCGLTVCKWHWRQGFNPRQSHTKDSKMVLDSALLNTQHYKVRIKDKVEQSRE